MQCNPPKNREPDLSRSGALGFRVTGAPPGRPVFGGLRHRRIRFVSTGGPADPPKGPRMEHWWLQALRET